MPLKPPCPAGALCDGPCLTGALCERPPLTAALCAHPCFMGTLCRPVLYPWAPTNVAVPHGTLMVDFMYPLASHTVPFHPLVLPSQGVDTPTVHCVGRIGARRGRVASDTCNCDTTWMLTMASPAPERVVRHTSRHADLRSGKHLDLLSGGLATLCRGVSQQGSYDCLRHVSNNGDGTRAQAGGVSCPFLHHCAFRDSSWGRQRECFGSHACIVDLSAMLLQLSENDHASHVRSVCGRA